MHDLACFMCVREIYFELVLSLLLGLITKSIHFLSSVTSVYMVTKLAGLESSFCFQIYILSRLVSFKEANFLIQTDFY